MSLIFDTDTSLLEIGAAIGTKNKERRNEEQFKKQSWIFYGFWKEAKTHLLPKWFCW